MNSVMILIAAMVIMAVLMLVVGFIGNKIVALLTPKSKGQPDPLKRRNDGNFKQ
ncbi:MAG: hypothetical protein K6D94_03655 [Clostridiales bacterium]|nr:hypothetical protein [Clostridiales bacterium]